MPVDKKYLDFFGNALHFQANHAVSGALAFDGSPIQTLIGGKTGTAEVYGKLDTSWLASWGPYQPGAAVADSKYVVVGMIEQAGTGASAAGPMLRQIWEGLLGANGTRPGHRRAPAPVTERCRRSAPEPDRAGAAGQPEPVPARSRAGPSAAPDALPTRSRFDQSRQVETASRAGRRR